MPKNYWMFVQTPEDFAISKNLGFTLHGLKSHQRRRAQRMEPDDRVLYYVSSIRKWVASASVTSPYFEDQAPIWNPNGNQDEFPYRVKLKPSIILDEKDYIDARELGPRLEYVKRWIPERWDLAFIDTLHLLPQRDFRLIEGEMKRIVKKGHTRSRNRRPKRNTFQKGTRPSNQTEPTAQSNTLSDLEDGTSQSISETIDNDSVLTSQDKLKHESHSEVDIGFSKETDSGTGST